MPWHGKLGEAGHCGGFFTAADFFGERVRRAGLLTV
jgi:hypothetical protein